MSAARPLRTALWLGLGPWAANGLGFLLGSPLLLPLLGAAVAFPVFLDRIRRRIFGGALGWMLYWASVQSLAVALLLTAAPDRGAQVVHRGPEYAAEMLAWVQTGEGAESSPRQFLPIHLRHFLGFCVLTVATAGAAALALGTWLLNYMNYYVVELVTQSARPILAATLGWHPWAVLRVAGFITTAVGLAPIGLGLMNRLRKRPVAHHPSWRFVLAGLALVVADALVKTLLAPQWQRWLLSAFSG